MSDLNVNEELAVTKNDIKHLENDMSEIKSGIKEINENFLKHAERMDEKYVRKDDFKEHMRNVDKKFDSMRALSHLLLGCVVTGIISFIVSLVLGHLK